MVVDNQDRLVLTAVYVLDENDNVLLLTRKADGSLEPPGGKLETTDCKGASFQEISCDDLKRCALRELFEELGQTFI
ncbi:MAG: NUDIX hydrolase, partial [Nanoarchaeota archaeon]